ncbi:MAG: 30S ribosomal protein S6 [Patescibacteria group bacterium]
MGTGIYQICFWLKDPGADRIPEAEQKKIEQAISRAGGAIISSRPLGKRPMAYPIKKQTTGFWGEVVFSLTPGKLKQVEKLLLYEDQILRKTIFTVLPEKRKKAVRPRKPAPVFETAPTDSAKEIKEPVSDKVLETKLKEILEDES